MELGESAEETARREVKEEAGIDIGALTLITVYSGKDNFVKLPSRVTCAYVTTKFQGRPEADGVESREVGFFGVDELSSSINGYFKEAVRRVVRSISNRWCACGANAGKYSSKESGRMGVEFAF